MSNEREMSRVREALRNIKGGESSKKQISLITDERSLKLAEVIIDQFKMLTGGTGWTGGVEGVGLKLPISRNQLFEAALNEYLEEASRALMEESFINVEELLDENPQNSGTDQEDENANVADSDLVVFPAHEWGFEKVFLGQKKWYSLRLAEWRVKNNTIRYVACYRTAPYSAITHYAEVKKIEPVNDGSGKYVIYFKGDPIELDSPIGRGGSWMGLRNIVYTTLSKLKAANDIWDL